MIEPQVAIVATAICSIIATSFTITIILLASLTTDFQLQDMSVIRLILLWIIFFLVTAMFAVPIIVTN